MKLSAAVLVFSALPALSAAGGNVRTANVIPRKGIDFGVLEGPTGCAKGARFNGRAHISQEFAQKLLSKVGLLPVSPLGGNIVQTTYLTATTKVHKDNLYNEDGAPEPAPKGTPVAFVAVNTNEDAYFRHGDTHVPIVEGQVIQFDGSIEHNTVVNSGNVQLLGPFEIPSFRTAGIPPAPTPVTPCEEREAEACCDDDFSACFLCPDVSFRNRKLKEDNKERGLLGGGFAGKKGFSKRRRNTCPFTCSSTPIRGDCARCFAQSNLYPFIPGSLKDVNDSTERIMDVVGELGGNMEGTFQQTQELVSPYERGILRDYADSELEKALQERKEKEEDIEEDIRIDLNPSDLEMLISPESIRSIFNTFEDYANESTISRIFLRRTSLSGNKHIQYHNDGDTVTMHLWLSEDGDVDGGNLVYLNRDGMTHVDAKPGVAALHGDSIVHGVTPLYGTRYILVLLGGETKVEEDQVEPVIV